jgi:predicted NACHT family NTPase
VEQVLRAGRGLLLIDGIDEIPERRREDTRRWLRELLREFPGNVCLVTARPSAVQERWLAADDFADVSLSPMSRNDVAAFVQRWHRAAGATGDEAGELLASIRSRADLNRLATNPLMCGLMCALHHVRHGYLPHGREALYDAALQMLLERREQERRVELPIRLDARSQRVLLQKLAYWLIRNGSSEMERDNAVHQIAQALPSMPQVARQGTAEVIYRHLLERSGLLREPAEGAVDFIHRTFQDYLAAQEAVEARDFKFLVNNAHLDQWEDVIHMAVAHARADECRQLLKDLVKRGRKDKAHRIRLHLLAMACLEQATQLDPDIRELVTSHAAELIPPRTLAEAQSLAAAGPVVLELLPEPETLRDNEALAVVQTAAMIGGDAATAVLARFCGNAHEPVIRQLWAAWDHFDTATYAETVAHISQTSASWLTHGNSCHAFQSGLA